MTIRVRIVKKHAQHSSVTHPNIVTDIYRAELLDIHAKCFLLLKHAKSRKLDFGESEAGSKGKSFLVDKIGLTINGKGEVLLISSTLTVFRVESEEENSDSFSVESFELSQKQREFGDEYAEYGAYGGQDTGEVSGGAIGKAVKGGMEN